MTDPGTNSTSSEAPTTKNGLLSLLRAPKFGDPGKDRLAGLQQSIAVGLFLTILLGLLITLLFWNSGSIRGLGIQLFEMFLSILAFYSLRRGHLERSGWILVSAMYIVFILASLLAGFTFPIALILALTISLAGLLLPYYGVIIITALSILTIWILPHLITISITPKPNELGYISVIVAAEGALLAVAARTLERSFTDASRSTQSLVTSNKDLHEMTATLEQRVEERTKTLTRQTSQLQAAADVSRAISNILDVNELVKQAVTLIHNQFGLQYVGLFLLNEQRNMAVLKAESNKTLAIVDKLEINDESVIGWAIDHKQARIARGTNKKMTSSTHAELALPLISQGQVIGAITLQSDQETAIIEQDINILQTVIDQLANSIEKARLYEQVQQRAIELDKASENANNARDDAEKARMEAEAANRNLAAQIWLTTGLAALNEKMRGEQDLATLAYHVIQHLCKYLKIENGAIYALENNMLKLTGSYAFRQQSLEQQYQLGEDLIGQAALEKEIITSQIPEEYIVISLSQEKILPKFRLVAPIAYNQQVSGVVNLESLNEFTSAQKQFIEKAMENIAIAFITAQGRARVNELFAQTRQQAEILQTQEEELRATNEELMAQSENLRVFKI